MPLWRQPSPICRVMLNALIPNGIDRRGARNWVSNPALRTMTESSLQRPLKYLPMIHNCIYSANNFYIHIHRARATTLRPEEHTSDLQSRSDLECRLLLEKKIMIHDRYVIV